MYSFDPNAVTSFGCHKLYFSQVTSADLHRHFHALNAGAIEDVRVQRDKGFGFVRFSTHAEAAIAIKMGNARMLYGKPVKVRCSWLERGLGLLINEATNAFLQCSWGSKPTPPGTSSTPLPPPAAAVNMPGFTAADFAAYERQMAMSKMGGAQALMVPQNQHALKAAMGMGGASQALYDGTFPGVATTQHLMYYQ